MGILEFVVLAAILGCIAWALVTYVPMPQPVKTLIVVAVVLFLVLVLCRATGILTYDYAIPRINRN